MYMLLCHININKFHIQIPGLLTGFKVIKSLPLKFKHTGVGKKKNHTFGFGCINI